MKGFPDLPPLWLIAFCAMAWILEAGLPILALFGPVYRGAGFLLILAGIGLIVASAVWFFRKKTTIEPHHAPSVLIVEGPYRVSRNPIYLGMVGILAGWIAWLGALSPVILLPVFVWILTRRFILPEEAALKRAFGSEADAYLRRTRRWI